ncbi:MAG: hypothetical protein M0007_12940 [Actinomycetota bacterium]|nr:hypothetical protein [Actinomycetota bacterium]
MGRTRKVICSIGTGPHAELLARSATTFRDYAERHGYDLCIHDQAEPSGRPPAWAKVLLIRQQLDRYDLVLWIDADAAVTDPSVDIADLLGRRDLMALVAHTTPEGDDPIPNCGVWLLRSHRATRRFLDRVWDSTAYVEHRWWENAAVLDLLGYELEPRVRLVDPSPMFRHTRLLDTEWNSIPGDAAPRPRIVHFPGLPLDERRAGLDAAVASAASRNAT